MEEIMGKGVVHCMCMGVRCTGNERQPSGDRHTGGGMFTAVVQHGPSFDSIAHQATRLPRMPGCLATRRCGWYRCQTPAASCYGCVCASPRRAWPLYNAIVGKKVTIPACVWCTSMWSCMHMRMCMCMCMFMRVCVCASLVVSYTGPFNIYYTY